MMLHSLLPILVGTAGVTLAGFGLSRLFPDSDR